MKRSPVRGLAAAVVVGMSVWGVWSWSGSVMLTLFGCTVLLVSVGPFFVPTDYRLGPEGVQIRRPWRTWNRPWSDFRSVRAGGELVLLSPFARRTWLEGIRGESLRVFGNREEVVQYVEKMVGKAGDDAGTG